MTRLFLPSRSRPSRETPARPARAPGAVSEDIAGGLIPVIWQPNDKGFSASYCQPGTCGAYDSLRLDCAKSLLGGQISIPGSDRVRPPWRIGVLRRFSRYSCTSASSSPRLKADLRPCRAFSLLLASSALCAASAFKFVHATDLLIRTWQPGRDHSCAASSPLMIATTDTPPPDPGQNAQFTTTHWSAVLAAGGGDSPAARQALEYLCQTQANH